MTPIHSGERSRRLVAVISSDVELQRALRLRRPPDFVELRLDALVACLDEVQHAIKLLRAPLIITARHPAEGGLNNLLARQRAALLLRLLPSAAYVDVELRSIAQMQTVLEKARTLHVRIILSVHDLRDTPSIDVLRQFVREAEKQGADIFKIATRTDTPAQLARLTQFFDECEMPIPICAMGMGMLGRASRAALLRKGSALNYAHLSSAAVEGQFSFVQLRRAARRALLSFPARVAAR